MRRLAFFALLIAPLVAAAADDPQNKTPEGFTALFDGKSFEGWHGMPHFDPRKLAEMGEDERSKQIAEWNADLKKHWKVENGELVNDCEGPYLTSDKDYGDIELLVDWKISPKVDSGLYLRGTPQVQVWDFTDEAKFEIGADKGSGGLWNNSAGAPGKDPLARGDNPIGQWNRFRIKQIGARTWVWVNDKLAVDGAIMENFWDRAAPLFARGPIQFQTHPPAGEIRWKNVFVREIGPDEAAKALARRDADDFRSIFDGETLEGWAGATGSYEVAGGSIRCKPEKGGVLYYDKELRDFAARVEFRVPPGGNNGLAIRYPGQGDTAYAGMTELQILDDDSEKYAGKLDPRQHHGSAYGMVAAKRGYLRPPGRWNFQEVTVKGSKIRVELNGTVILDTDLADVKEFKDNSPHPGKDRTSGYFGFAGHNDPVEFRSVSIRPLD